jgi:hypothetical protein
MRKERQEREKKLTLVLTSPTTSVQASSLWLHRNCRIMARDIGYKLG